MKHILNNLSNEEKNSIREQHTGGMNVITENFSKLLNSKLGDSKPLVSEQAQTAATIAAKKPTPMSVRVKQLIGYLKNNSYTSSEIYQAQQYIKNVKPAPATAQQKPAPAKPAPAKPAPATKPQDYSNGLADGGM